MRANIFLYTYTCIGGFVALQLPKYAWNACKIHLLALDWGAIAHQYSSDAIFHAYMKRIYELTGVLALMLLYPVAHTHTHFCINLDQYQSIKIWVEDRAVEACLIYCDAGERARR